jgi:hypothetical protein
MYASYDDSPRSRTDRGPSIYYGYCDRSRRYRMMDLPDFMTNVQQGMTRMVTDAQAAYQDMLSGYQRPGSRGSGERVRGERPHGGGCHDCGCHERCCSDCHCECCVTDADVLVHARCGEIRRIPVTFENDSRRERHVKLELDKFVTKGGLDLKWNTLLSETEFTVKPCDERTIIVSVLVRCDTFKGGSQGDTPQPSDPAKPGGSVDAARVMSTAASDRLGSVDRCEVAYATLRAEGCAVRPAVLAVAVLPDDCDAYRRSCSCGCCH